MVSNSLVYIAAITVLQGAVAVIALPLIRWLFRSAVGAAGLRGLEMSSVITLASTPTSVVLLIAVVVVAFIALSFQLAALVLMSTRLQSGLPVTVAGLLADAKALGRLLLRPRSAWLVGYLLVVLPLGNFGFASVLTQAIAVPSFVSGELLKSTTGTILYVLFLLGLALVNARLVLTIPAFVAGEARPLRTSWRMTKGITLPIIVTVSAIILLSTVLISATLALSLLPTALADAVWPAAAPAVASVSLAIAQVLTFLLVGATTAALVSTTVKLYRVGTDWKGPAGIAPIEPESNVASNQDFRRPALLAGATLVTLVAGLSIVNYPVMEALEAHPDTLILGHRGFSGGGVENTIPGLEAAAEAGADLTEMDVLQTKDNQFVVMHDVNLQRLTGQDLAVADLTLEELTALTVTDLAGHSAVIPSLRDYVVRAQELGMPLLIEIKTHGGESPDMVELLIGELEELQAMDNNMFHSLDKPAIERLKQLRPDVYAGYIFALAGVNLPPTTADFVVIEEASYTSGLRDDARANGKGVFVWTVNAPAAQRQMLRDEVDGLITDHPDTALIARNDIDSNPGLTGRLIDAIDRFVVIN
nr:glycerophosphoryl diester phosphodiesterase membrane domain-containing protein [Lysinibacter cavernae]